MRIIVNIFSRCLRNVNNSPSDTNKALCIVENRAFAVLRAPKSAVIRVLICMNNIHMDKTVLGLILFDPVLIIRSEQLNVAVWFQVPLCRFKVILFMDCVLITSKDVNTFNILKVA